MSQQLSDKVAQVVMAEIDLLVKRVDNQLEKHTALDQKITKNLDSFSHISNIALEETRKVAYQVINQSVAETHLKLANAIKTTAEKVAYSTAQQSASKWVSVAVSISIFASLLIGLSAFIVGKNAGEKIGYANAVDEKIAVAWANTPNGILAKQLSDAGSIKHLAECNQPGWTISKEDNGKYCYPKPAENGLYGWRIEVR